MPQKKQFDFKTVFDKFYEPVYRNHFDLIDRTAFFPGEEIQRNRLVELSSQPCAFAMLVDNAFDSINPIEGCKFPFPQPSISIKEFCKYVHPNYLIPFLVYAGFIYEMAKAVKIPPEEVYKYSYKIPLPLRLMNTKEYYWYTQKSYALSLNTDGRVINHINLYELDRICLNLPNGEIEHRFVEASILKENNLSEVFHAHLKERTKTFLADLFKNQIKQWKMIEALKKDIGISLKLLSQKIDLKEETIKSYSKDILSKIRMTMGYQFTSLKEAVLALETRGFI